MKKQAIIAMIFVSSFALTGCIEDLLSSLCNRLAGSNSVITFFATSGDFANSKAVLVYEKVTQAGSEFYERSECKSDFVFPNGDRKNQSGSTEGNGIYFVTALDETGLSFFSNSLGLNEADNFRVSVSFYSGCDENGDPTGNEVGPFVSAEGPVTWEDAIAVEIPPELALVGECTITGRTGSFTVNDIQ